MGRGWFEEDEFGVPGRMLNLSDEFYGALGRVAAMGALVDLKMSDLIRALTKNHDIAGQPLRYQLPRFDEYVKERRNDPQREDVSDRLIAAVAEIDAAMKQRHDVIHGIWPGERIEWLNVARKIRKRKVVRAAGSKTNTLAGVDDIKIVIRRLVAAVDAVTPFIRSPVD